MNQRKGVRKSQPCPFCPPATQSHNGATKKGEVRAFSGVAIAPPRRKFVFKNVNLFPKKIWWH
jgi:hypothetical protein